jgi:hypothetical protein
MASNHPQHEPLKPIAPPSSVHGPGAGPFVPGHPSPAPTATSPGSGPATHQKPRNDLPILERLQAVSLNNVIDELRSVPSAIIQAATALHSRGADLLNASGPKLVDLLIALDADIISEPSAVAFLLEYAQLLAANDFKGAFAAHRRFVAANSLGTAPYAALSDYLGSLKSFAMIASRNIV